MYINTECSVKLWYLCNNINFDLNGKQRNLHPHEINVFRKIDGRTNMQLYLLFYNNTMSLFTPESEFSIKFITHKKNVLQY